jgi:GAF domain-containing protein
MDTSKDMCLYNQGIYTFIPLIWGGRPITLKENCCYFEGAPYCEYHLRWPIWNRLYEIYSRFFTSKSVLMETVREMEEDKKIIEAKYEEVNSLNLELNYKIEQLMAIQKTGKAIMSVLDLDQLLTVIINILSNVCKINRAMIMLVNDEEGCLEYQYGIGFDGEVPEEVKDYTVPLSCVSNILARVVTTGRPEYVPDIGSSGLSRENIILTHCKSRSVFVIPLITRSKVIGIIATDSNDGEEVTEKTRETMGIFAPQIAIAIENARLYSKLQEQMSELKKIQCPAEQG